MAQKFFWQIFVSTFYSKPQIEKIFFQFSVGGGFIMHFSETSILADCMGVFRSEGYLGRNVRYTVLFTIFTSPPLEIFWP